MKKIVNIIIIALILFIPTKIYAISKDYKDNISKYTNAKIEENKINLYLFHGKECPHCEEERQWLKQIKEDYKDYLNVNYYEVWHNEENAKIMDEVSKEYEVDRDKLSSIKMEDYDFCLIITMYMMNQLIHVEELLVFFFYKFLYLSHLINKEYAMLLRYIHLQFEFYALQNNILPHLLFFDRRKYAELELNGHFEIKFVFQKYHLIYLL